MSFYLLFPIVLVGIFLFYFFAYQIQFGLASAISWISSKVGKRSKVGQYELERYVFLHRTSLVSKIYNFVNNLIVNMNLKSAGVTPFGFLVFWFIVAIIISVIVSSLLGLTLTLLPLLTIIVLFFELVMIRVAISENMERRESCIMDAVDLVIPELRDGVRNSIIRNKTNFAPMIQSSFNEFELNMSRRKMSFNVSMMILADRLGPMFRDFAQQAIIYEESGEKDMLDIFVETVETNRLRRELRDINNRKFVEKKREFVVSTILLVAYGLYTISTDAFTRNFLLNTDGGKLLVIFMFLDTIAVLAYMSTMKSKEL